VACPVQVISGTGALTLTAATSFQQHHGGFNEGAYIRDQLLIWRVRESCNAVQSCLRIDNVELPLPSAKQLQYLRSVLLFNYVRIEL